MENNFSDNLRYLANKGIKSSTGDYCACIESLSDYFENIITSSAIHGRYKCTFALQKKTRPVKFIPRGWTVEWQLTSINCEFFFLLKNEYEYFYKKTYKNSIEYHKGKISNSEYNSYNIDISDKPIFTYDEYINYHNKPYFMFDERESGIRFYEVYILKYTINNINLDMIMAYANKFSINKGIKIRTFTEEVSTDNDLMNGIWETKISLLEFSWA